MFNNLSQREKVLSILVLCLVPASLIFFSVMSFINRYGDNNAEIINLENQISGEQQKVLLAMKAKQRLNYYTQTSLSPEFSKAVNDYQFWLLQLRDELKLEDFRVSNKSAPLLKYQNEELARTQQIEVTADGTLDQIVQFLSRFYATDALHRMVGLRLVPEMQAVRGTAKKVRTGKIRMVARIEIAALTDAEESDRFVPRQRELARPIDDYVQNVVGRNIFGPPNNSPVVSARPRSSYASNQSFSLRLDVDDTDKDDEISWELVETNLEGATLDIARNNDRSATLNVPPQVAGTYSVTVKVVDNGFPVKDDVADFEIIVKDQPNRLPSLIVNTERSYPADRSIEVLIEGKDDDPEDQLVFAIEEGIEEAELVDVDGKPRQVQLILPGLDVGRYDFVVSVSDGREEADADLVTKEFTINVVRKFTHFSETRMTSILRDVSGTWQVNVTVRTTGQQFSLTEGESLTLEGRTWVVAEIRRNEVDFREGNRLYTIPLGVPFSQPLKTELLAASSDGEETLEQIESGNPSTGRTDSTETVGETGAGRRSADSAQRSGTAAAERGQGESDTARRSRRGRQE